MGSAEAPTPVQAPVCSIVNEGPAAPAACSIVNEAAPAPAADSKPKKKICCACPDTKRLRDECIVEYGESACTKWIEAHKQCLRAEGFKV
ncbi:hypothetical protein ACQJBY_056105 [Aegilops geniculata]